jgi:hypothetical protein
MTGGGSGRSRILRIVLAVALALASLACVGGAGFMLAFMTVLAFDSPARRGGPLVSGLAFAGLLLVQLGLFGACALLVFSRHRRRVALAAGVTFLLGAALVLVALALAFGGFV